MELHNHLVQPEQRNVLHIAGYPQSFADPTGLRLLHVTQIVVGAGRPTHMPMAHLRTQGAMS